MTKNFTPGQWVLRRQSVMQLNGKMTIRYLPFMFLDHVKHSRARCTGYCLRHMPDNDFVECDLGGETVRLAQPGIVRMTSVQTSTLVTLEDWMVNHGRLE